MVDARAHGHDDADVAVGRAAERDHVPTRRRGGAERGRHDGHFLTDDQRALVALGNTQARLRHDLEVPLLAHELVADRGDLEEPVGGVNGAQIVKRDAGVSTLGAVSLGQGLGDSVLAQRDTELTHDGAIRLEDLDLQHDLAARLVEAADDLRCADEPLGRVAHGHRVELDGLDDDGGLEHLAQALGHRLGRCVRQVKRPHRELLVLGALVGRVGDHQQGGGVDHLVVVPVGDRQQVERLLEPHVIDLEGRNAVLDAAVEQDVDLADPTQRPIDVEDQGVAHADAEDLVGGQRQLGRRRQPDVGVDGVEILIRRYGGLAGTRLPQQAHVFFTGQLVGGVHLQHHLVLQGGAAQVAVAPQPACLGEVEFRRLEARVFQPDLGTRVARILFECLLVVHDGGIPGATLERGFGLLYGAGRARTAGNRGDQHEGAHQGRQPRNADGFAKPLTASHRHLLLFPFSGAYTGKRRRAPRYSISMNVASTTVIR